MWITNSDFACLEKFCDTVRDTMMKSETFAKEYPDVVIALKDMDDVVFELKQKRKKDNVRCSAYIAKKRKEIPGYACGYVKKEKKD